MSYSPEKFTVAVLYGGIWGFVWADLAAQQGHQVKVYTKNQQDCDIFNQTHTYRKVPGKTFSENIIATTDSNKALDNADVLTLAPRFKDLRELVRGIEGWKPRRGVLNLSKGLEADTGFRALQIIEEEQPEWVDLYAAWSGPNIAGRIAAGESARAHIASANWEIALFLERFFGRGNITLVPTADVIGTEYGGAFKNVRTMAEGLIFGLGWEDISEHIRLQGKKETVEIGVAHGALRETFNGPSGDEDFEASVEFRSRNFMSGFIMASEHKAAADLEASGVTYEGLSTIKPTLFLAEQACVNAMVTKMVAQVAFPNSHDF